MVSLARMTAAESTAAVSAIIATDMLSARRLSTGEPAEDESSVLIIDSESDSRLSPMALPASIPNDCIAATVTIRSGTHIFAIRLFIQDGKGTNNFCKFADSIGYLGFRVV